MIIPNIWEKKNVPNHQPDKYGEKAGKAFSINLVQNWENLISLININILH